MAEWTGIIHTDRVAIGGETLGLALESDDGWFDLIPDDDTVDAAIRGLHGREAIVTGTLGTDTGIERGTYDVIRVASVRRI